MDLHKIWRAALSEIELSVSNATFKTQFSKTKLISLAEGVANVGVPNPMIRTMIETRYYSLVKSVLDHHTKLNTSVVFSLLQPETKLGDAGPLFSQATLAPSVDAASLAKRLHVRPDATFDTFAVSSSNQIAYAAATAVAKTPGTAYNPLFFHGGVGVGKTHLMHAVANDLLSKKPNTKIVYCMGEEFLNEIIEAIQTKTARQFKQKYRSAQLLLVDDVQFIAGKQTAQEEFFHTFNAVHREGGQVILTSDRPPGEISRLEDRLRSRFEGGLIVDISNPDFELRVAIVNLKSQALGLSVPPDASRMIAANHTEARAIEGFLRRLSTELFAGKEITTELVATLLKVKQPGGENQKLSRRVTPQEIMDAVSEHFSIKASALKGQKRDRPVVRPRQIIMYLCKNELGLTLSDVGGLLGGRDHTTVMHGVETITRELSTNQRLRDSVEGIKSRLWGNV